MYKDWKLGEIFLLLSQFFERIAHYSITANLVMMLLSHPLNWTTSNSLAAPFLLNGFSFISSMIGGVLSDICLKKYTTVIIGYIFYISYLGFPYIFWNDRKLADWCHQNVEAINTDVSIVSETCSNIILPSIIFSAIGSGLIRSVVASIGLDMVNKRWENPSTFFNIYYWCLNGGSLIALLVFSLVQQKYSRKWGYVAPSIILAASFISFLLGMPFYINKKRPERSTIALVFNIYLEACKKKWALFRERKRQEVGCSESQENIIREERRESLFHEESDFDHDYQDSFGSVTNDNSLTQRSEFDGCIYSKRSSINKPIGDTTSSHIIETESYTRTDHVPFLDRCQIRFGGTFSEIDVEDVRKFTFILAILFFMIPYYMIYFQMESTYMYQGMNMRVEIGSKDSKFNIPASWLIVLDIILLMFLLPFLVNVIYPWLRAKRKYLRQTSKIALGLIFAACSVAIAGLVETRRLYVRWALNETITQVIDNTTYEAADMTVFYQIPQYVFMGFSEALAVVAGLELACTQVSASMRGLTNGLFWFTSGLGSFVGTGFLYIFKNINFHQSYTCHDSNLTCHLNIYFFILMGFIFFIFGFFILFLWKYRKIERVEQNQLFIRRVSA